MKNKEYNLKKIKKALKDYSKSDRWNDTIEDIVDHVSECIQDNLSDDLDINDISNKDLKELFGYFMSCLNKRFIIE